MSLPHLNLPLPGATPFLRWAHTLLEDLVSYNVPSPDSEDLWLPWATQVFFLPDIQAAGVADPRGFARWQDWATTFLQVPN